MSKRYEPAFGGNPRILCLPGNQKALWADCTTAYIPSAVGGYEKGCILQDTQAGKIYKNEGTVTSCSFAEILSGTGTGYALFNNASWKVWDALQTNLPGTAAADDLGITTGTFLTDIPVLKSVDYGGTSTTAYAMTFLQIPNDYKAGTDLTLKIYAGMQVVSDNSASLDVEVVNLQDLPDADVCTTAAQSINSASLAFKDFTLSSAALAVGCMLMIRLKFTGTDAGNAQNNINALIYPFGFTYTRNR